MKKKCISMNYLKDSSRFSIFERKYEYLHLIRNRLSPWHFYDEIIKPTLQKIGEKVIPIFIGSKPEEYKGIRKIKYEKKVISNLFKNRFSLYFWYFGESIINPLIISVLLIISYASCMYFGKIKVYSSCGMHVDGFINYLYFSIVTFTSLGYGDFRPGNDWLSKLSMGLESILGLLCISLVVFLLGRKSMK